MCILPFYPTGIHRAAKNNIKQRISTVNVLKIQKKKKKRFPQSFQTAEVTKWKRQQSAEFPNLWKIELCISLIWKTFSGKRWPYSFLSLLFRCQMEIQKNALEAKATHHHIIVKKTTQTWGPTSLVQLDDITGLVTTSSMNRNAAQKWKDNS